MGVGKPPLLDLENWGMPLGEFRTRPRGVEYHATSSKADWYEAPPDYCSLSAISRRCCPSRCARRAPRGLAGATLESGEPELRAACRDLWGVPLHDVYSANELGYIALQCPESEQYHVMSECALVEVIDGDGRPCRPGETGRLVLSSLHNYAMPLLRYEIGDYAEVGDQCPCGRGLPLLNRIAGRERNMLVLPDGRQHWPTCPRTVAADARCVNAGCAGEPGVVVEEVGRTGADAEGVQPGRRTEPVFEFR